MTALFGKAPDSAEFVREGSFGEPEVALETALLTRVERGHALAPARFLVAGADYVRAGAWLPSQDALGRAFPLVISLPLPTQSLLSIVPLHYMELLDSAVEALHARLQGARGTPYLIAPHLSLLLPRVHRARAALLREPASRFQARALRTRDRDALAYALATLLRAAALDEPVALALPSADEGVLFAWMELLGALGPAQALALVWDTTGHAWLGWDMDLAALLTRERAAWPLASDDETARRDARAYVGNDVCRTIERDGAMATVLDLLAMGHRHAG
jgi:hypothetical protein